MVLRQHNVPGLVDSLTLSEAWMRSGQGERCEEKQEQGRGANYGWFVKMTKKLKQNKTKDFVKLLSCWNIGFWGT